MDGLELAADNEAKDEEAAIRGVDPVVLRVLLAGRVPVRNRRVRPVPEEARQLLHILPLRPGLVRRRGRCQESREFVYEFHSAGSQVHTEYGERMV